MTRKFWMAAALALALVGGTYAQEPQKTETPKTEKKKKGSKKKKSEKKGEEAPAAPPK